MNYRGGGGDMYYKQDGKDIHLGREMVEKLDRLEPKKSCN